jgi:hypothetical protein
LNNLEATKVLLRLACFPAFPVVLIVSTALPVADAAYFDEGLDEIIARLEWYDTSIQSFRIRYQIIREPHPAGRRRMTLAEGRKDALAEQWVDKRDDLEEEFVSSGDKVWVKLINHNPSPAAEDQALFVWAYDSKETRSIAHRADGTPTHGGVGGDFAKGRIPLDSPTLVAGMRFSSRKSPLYMEMKEGRWKLEGTVKEAGRLLYHLSYTPPATEADQTHLYLDPKYMFLPRRRERWHRGKLWNRTSVEEFARFADVTTKEERWFPAKVIKEDFFEGELATTNKVTCESLEINPSIPDSLFDLTIPGGILVIDNKTQETRFRGTDEQRREFALQKAAKAKADLAAELAKASMSQRTVSPPRRLPWVSLGIGFLGVGMVFFGLVLLRRRHSA